MKRFDHERATSYPYGHLVIDLKSDTPEKDRLHIEIFDTVKSMDEKMAVEKGIIGTQYEEEEERGGLRKRRGSEEEGGRGRIRGRGRSRGGGRGRCTSDQVRSASRASRMPEA